MLDLARLELFFQLDVLCPEPPELPGLAGIGTLASGALEPSTESGFGDPWARAA